MTESTAPRTASIIYIVGVPATGKTTLIDALAKRLQFEEPEKQLVVLSEVARELFLREKMRHEDIQAGEESAMDLQRQILETQMMREVHLTHSADRILSDRSGVDPIAFAMKYGGPSRGQALLKLEAWIYLRKNMQHGLVILCEPTPQWFVDDGVRVVPVSATEMGELHNVFCDVLQSQEIPFEILPASVVDRQQRVDFVVHCLRRFERSWLHARNK